MRVIAISMLVWMSSAVAAQGVENFRLMDHRGDSHHLYYFTDKDAVVLVAQARTCDGAAATAAEVQEISAAHEAVQFFLMEATEAADRAALGAFAEAHAPDVPVLIDELSLASRSLGFAQAGEAVVIDPQTWQTTYRGPVAGVAGALSGDPGSDSSANVESLCYLNLAAALDADLTYVDHVAPILERNCVVCHRPGGIGPWAMNSYEMVRGFSLMMREVVMTQRMPPWHADPTIGHFANDRSLSAEEARMLVAWAESGAARGEGEDPLAGYTQPLPDWGELGEPDLVIDIPPTDVPASGVVDYQYKFVKNPLDRDVWVRASQIVPGDRAVLHHVITRFGTMETEGPRKGRLSRKGRQGGLAGYVPGYVVRELPEGTGTLLPAGATIEFQMHYTTQGKATTDHSRIGIYFHEAPPEHEVRTLILANPRLRIPAHAKAHAEQAVRTFEQDSLVYSLLPHSHYRGKAARFEAVYPDGSRETLLNVPNYDFNWQTTYVLAEPKWVPAGTQLIYTNWWDNSAQNPANPDPNREVTWGEQSWDEMIFGAVAYRVADTAESGDVAQR